MNKLIRNPVTNAVGMGLFSGFYGFIFLRYSGLVISQTGQSEKSFWILWDKFLEFGGHKITAWVLIALAAVIICLLVRHKPYDEYHTAILVNCLVAALLLTLAAIAVIFLVILSDPAGVIGKYSFFISLNWVTIIVSNSIYLLICRHGRTIKI